MRTRELTLKEFKGLYNITDTGDLYSLRKNKKLKPAENSSGYLMYFITPRVGDGKWFMAHRLVLITFKGDKAGCEVNHIDHDKQNNNLSNLEWVTHSENIKKSYESGRRKPNRSAAWRIGAVASEETRLKMAAKKNKALIVTDTTTGIEIQIESINKAADIYNLNRRTVSRYLLGSTQHKYLLFSFA